MIISFMSLDDGVSSKDLSNDKIGRDPLRQFPDKFNSSLQLSLIDFFPRLRGMHYFQLLHGPLKGYTIL